MGGGCFAAVQRYLCGWGGPEKKILRDRKKGNGKGSEYRGLSIAPRGERAAPVAMTLYGEVPSHVSNPRNGATAVE
jgi:hypothetical protein